MKADPWQEILSDRLPLLGHRNWIGVVDSAYPWQTSPGIETVATGAEHLAVLRALLDAVRTANHIRPLVRLDSELNAVPESAAPGISTLRDKMLKLFEGTVTEVTPHDETIRRLEKTASSFRVLLFKSTLAIPYTSVFLELECGYWSAAAEKSLRASLEKEK